MTADMDSEDLYALVPPWPERFNLCEYYLDRNVIEGRADKVALACGDRTQTYGALLERVRSLTAVLRRLGLRPEERVLLALPDGFEFVESWFAVLRAGGVFAMVNPLLKQADFAKYLAYTRARIVITHPDALDEVGPAALNAKYTEHVLVTGDDVRGWAPYETLVAGEDAHGPLTESEPTQADEIAGWLFTSGSTGMPKACVHTHGDFAYSTETYASKVAGYREDDICISVPKLFFGYATGSNLMFPFRVGAGVVLFAGRATPDELFDQVERFRPTLMTSVPTMFNNMLRSARIDQVDLTCLRTCLSAGEALPPKLYEAWKAKTGVEILDGIGSAEMFHIYISNAPGDVQPGSLGRIVPGYEALIVDDDGNPVADGEIGRLRVRGGSTALCYWGDKARSRETFQGEWCTSADIMRRDAEGYYYYEGRADDLLKVSGIFVSPLEIENALLSHDAVAEVCVVAREDQEKLVKPLAFVVLNEGHHGSDELAAALKRHVKDRLAPYKYPRWFEWRDSLPKNDRGKVARKELKAESATAR